MSSFQRLFIGILAFVFVQSFTECEDQYLGWSKLNDTFSEKHVITICDKRFRGGSIYVKQKKKYTQIDCYIDPKTKELYSCRFHHLYGTFNEYINVFRFTAYCVIARETRKYLESGIKINIEKVANLKQLFQLLMIHIDEVNPPPIYSDSYMNIMNQNIWMHDYASFSCMSFIPNMPQYIGNPLHCLSALSLLFETQHVLNVSHEESSYVAVRYNEQMFPKNTLLTSLLETYFGDILTIEHVLKYEGIEDGDDLYIKELLFNSKNWLKDSLYANSLQIASKRCAGTLLRSQVLISMADKAKQYWNNKIQMEVKRNWLYWIYEEREMNGFQVYTKYKCLGAREYFNALDLKRNIVFVSSKYVENKCVAEKCINRMDIFIDELFMGLLVDGEVDDYDLGIDILIVGNPYLLSFELQYLLFRSSTILIGISDPIFSVAALFMQPQSILFEIVIEEAFNFRSLAKMSNLRYYKMNDMMDMTTIANIDIKKIQNSLR